MLSRPAIHADERTLLLVGDACIPAAAEATAKRNLRLRTQIGVLFFVCVLYFYTYIGLATEISIQEDIICDAYYNALDSHDSAMGPLKCDCTVDGVQGELNLLNQVYATLHQLPGILSLPYGVVADRVGRRKVFIVSITGIVLGEIFRLLVNRIVAMLEVFRKSLINLFAIKGVILFMFGFFAATIGKIAGLFEVQYLYKRFGWSYLYTASVLAIRPAITLAVLLVIIPMANKILIEKWGVASVWKDVILTRISVALLTAGTLLLCIADGRFLVILSFVVFALGNGFMTLGKSLLVALGPREMTGTLLSAMIMSASLGSVLAGPLIGFTFDWGLKRGGVWLASPLFLVTLLYAVTLGFVCAIKIPNKHQADDDNDDNDNEGEQEAQT